MDRPRVRASSSICSPFRRLAGAAALYVWKKRTVPGPSFNPVALWSEPRHAHVVERRKGILRGNPHPKVRPIAERCAALVLADEHFVEIQAVGGPIHFDSPSVPLLVARAVGADVAGPRRGTVKADFPLALPIGAPAGRSAGQ